MFVRILIALVFIVPPALAQQPQPPPPAPAPAESQTDKTKDAKEEPDKKSADDQIGKSKLEKETGTINDRIVEVLPNYGTVETSKTPQEYAMKKCASRLFQNYFCSGARTRTAFGTTSISTGVGPNISPSPWNMQGRSVVNFTVSTLKRLIRGVLSSPLFHNRGNSARICKTLWSSTITTSSHPSSSRASGASLIPAP